MSWRTPSSLKWLIVKRSRLSGSLSQMMAEEAKLHEELGALQRRIDKASRDLAGVDHVLGLHELSIEPGSITPVVPKRAKALTKYGHMTRLIYRALKDAGGESTTARIQEFMLLADPELQQHEPHYVAERIRNRLKNLVKKGSLISVKVHDKSRYPGKDFKVLWRLPEE